MRLRVRYFASIREFTGLSEESVEVPEGSTAEALRRKVQGIHASLKGQEGNILVAVNGSFAEPKRILKQGDEVALFPPVSGG
ncbi:TPA: molybdopterin converting factor subunit 1 [Candidatus Bathyarchaeota archaeon]|nr:molybdopterin converting factor subunit 1 [Candidatus Bathyarchaeota archaeon]